MKIITRANQQPDVLYRVVADQSRHDGPFEELGIPYFFVTPDGDGRLFYASRIEAMEQHGDLPCHSVGLTWEA